MLYSQSVKNMVSGISQQAPMQRFPEQLERQINGLSTESEGLQKRPPTVFIKKLMEALNKDIEPFLHFIDRDEKEKYIVYFYNNEIFVYDVNGNKYNVTYKHDKDYIKTHQPRKSLRVITVADYTFIVNREKIVRMRAEKSPDYFRSQGALVVIKQGQYGRTYKIKTSGREIASHQTPDGSDKSHTHQIDTHYIAEQLANKVRSSGYTVDLGDCWLRIHDVDNVETQDGFNNLAMIGLTNTIQRFNLLPNTAPDNYTVYVKTDPNGDEAGSYYIKYSARNKIWEECVRPNIPLGYDPATMPHALIRQSDGSFSFEQVKWKDRKVGDEDSNPLPSFVDSTLNDVLFYRNRLGFISGENIILSESAEYFNFWMTTASDILDIDPIDVTTTTNRVNILNYAVPFDGELYCFSDKSQFVLRSDTTLSPRNTALVEVTGFQSSPDCRPVRCGRNLYFSAERAEYTSIQEYYSVQQTSDEKNAQDITSHVPNYIPNGVYQIEAGSNENIMLILTTGAKDKIYVYKYLFLNEQRVQSSWSEWHLGGNIYGAFFVGSTLYLILDRGSTHVLEKINFTTSGSEDFPSIESYRVYLDSKKIASNGVYDELNETTTFDIAKEYELMNTNDLINIGIVLDDNTYIEFNNQQIVNGKITVRGNYSNKNVIIGIPYDFFIKLSTIYIHRSDNQGTTKAITNGRLQLRYLQFNYSNTGGFTVDVVRKGNKNAYQYKMTARKLGVAILDEVPLQTGIFKVPIQSLNENIDIYVSSKLTYPVSLIDFLWAGTWVQKSRGV